MPKEMMQYYVNLFACLVIFCCFWKFNNIFLSISDFFSCENMHIVEKNLSEIICGLIDFVVG